MNVLLLQRDLNDSLPKFAWPGGYPIHYVTPQGDSLCASCATEELDQWCDADWRGPNTYIAGQPLSNYYDGPQYADINYEDDDLYCTECHQRIESAYGGTK